MAGNLTRINNNQITDAVSGNTQFGINANTKVQPYSITSTLLANNLTYGSDLTVTGNLSVTGNVTAIDTTNTTIEDPLLLLASTQTGSPTVDIGYIGQRGTSNNIAFVWDESLSTFVTVYTDSGAGDHTNINILSYADFKTANANVTGDLIAGNVSLNGNVTSPLNVTGNIAAGNIYAVGLISATGNVETGGFFMGDGSMISNINAGNVATYRIVNGNSSANIGTPAGNMVVTINNNLNSTFYDTGVSFVGNIDTGNSVNAGNLSLTGNVLSDLIVDGTIISGDIIPSANATYSLGNATNVWSAAYLSPNTLYVGPVAVGANATANVLTVNNNIVVTYQNGNADISASGNVQAGDTINTTSLSLSGNVISTLNITSDVTAQNLYATTTVSSAGNVNAFDTVNTQSLSLSGNVISALNVTLDATAQNLYATTTVSSAGNVNAYDTLNANQLSLSGNVISDLNVTTNVNANNVNTTTDVSATGNVYGANFATTGPQGNITGANVVSAITFTATGNVYAVNVFASTDVSATGNVTTQQTFNGNALTGNSLVIGSLSGGLLFSVTGNISAGTNYVTNIINPENPQDAATKAYVDASVQGLQVKTSSNTATTGNIFATTGQTYTYDNGTSGVGATITFGATGNVTIDTVLLTSGMRVLIKNEPLNAPTDGTTPSAAYNGIYTVTTAGSPSAALVLTRATDNDVPGDMYSAYTFITSPAGSSNSSSGWASTNTPTSPGDPIVVGTTFYNWVQFSAAGTYTGGNAIDVTGSTISALYDGNTIGVNGSNQLYIPANAPLVSPNIGDATGTSLSVTGSVIGNIFQANTLSVTGNAFLGNISTGNISLSGNVLTDLNVTTDIKGNNVYAVNNFSAGGNVYGANFATTGSGGNITGANVISATTLTASGNVYGNYTEANLAAVNTSVYLDYSTVNTLMYANSSGYLVSSTITSDGSNVSTAGNVTAGNITTSGPSGNITGANVISATTLTATGNVGAGSYLFGDGGYISNINAANVSSTKISNGGSYANIAAPDGNLVIAVGASSNVAATFYDTGADFGGNISTVGNVNVGTDINLGGNSINDVNNNGIQLYSTNSSQLNYDDSAYVYVDLTGAFLETTGGTVQLDNAGNVTLPFNLLGQGGNYVQPDFIQPNGSDPYWSFGVDGDNSTQFWMQAQFNGGQTNHGFRVYDNYNATVPFKVDGDANVTATTQLVTPSVTSSTSLLNVGTAGYSQISLNGYSANLVYVNSNDNTVSIGSNVVTTGATFAINATDSMLLPVGNVAQRPVTPATGMLRYNSTVSQCEIWNGAAWVAVGGSSYTVITNEQFDGDGTTVAFTLGSSQTTDSCIVTINGVVQIPTTAYSVSGVYPTCVLTFTEAPEIGDTIDVREITTTTTVTAISNSTGNSIVSVEETTGQVDITGNLVAQLNPAAPSLTANSTMSFQLVNNTTLAILVRGTDGVTRSTTLTLS